MTGATVDDPKIVCRDIAHWFRDKRTNNVVQAISHVDLDVREREFVTIVGPSGCGKTTLLNMIAGLESPSRGEIAIDGRRVEGVDPDSTGYMFARDTLLPWRTVLRNVEIGLEFARVKQRAERARELVALVGLAGFEDHYPDQLSHGMRQRVAIARTLAREPQVLLMDEPFGALDAQTRIVVQNEFVRLWESRRSTVVFVTHDLTEAIALGDRVMVFSARPGRIRSEYVVDLPRPRVVDELQSDPRFQSLHRRVWADLKTEAHAAEAGAGA